MRKLSLTVMENTSGVVEIIVPDDFDAEDSEAVEAAFLNVPFSEWQNFSVTGREIQVDTDTKETNS